MDNDSAFAVLRERFPDKADDEIRAAIAAACKKPPVRKRTKGKHVSGSQASVMYDTPIGSASYVDAKKSPRAVEVSEDESSAAARSALAKLAAAAHAPS